MENLILSKTFEDIIKVLDTDKFHIFRSIKPILAEKELTYASDQKYEYYVDKWCIYDKDMPFDEFFSDNNKPLIDSLTATVDVLKEFCKKNGGKQKMVVRDLIKITNLLNSMERDIETLKDNIDIQYEMSPVIYSVSKNEKMERLQKSLSSLSTSLDMIVNTLYSSDI